MIPQATSTSFSKIMLVRSVSKGCVERLKLTSRFAEAVRYLAELQIRTKEFRKGSDTPYIAHLLGVASLVLESNGNEDETIAALFHDAIEDQWTTRGDIRQRFGERVASIVEGCTDTDQYPKPPWKERKVRYIEHLKQAPAEVLRVSLADKLYNAKSILRDLQQNGKKVWNRFNAGREEQLWYYSTLVSIYREKTQGWMLDELERTVSQISQLG